MKNYSEQFRNERAESAADHVRAAIKNIAYSNQRKGLGEIVFCHGATSVRIDLREITRENRAEFNYVGRMTGEYVSIDKTAQRMIDAILALTPQKILSLYEKAAPEAFGYEAVISTGGWGYEPVVFA